MKEDTKDIIWWAVIAVAAILVIVVLSGCGGLPTIKLPGIAVKAPPMPGKPATIAKSDSGVSVALPEGSRLVKTEYAPLPATEKTEAQPAKTVTEIIPGGPTEYHETKATVDAQTGTVDTSVAKKKIEAEESRPLLYAAIVSALAAGFFVYRAYPTPAICCGGSAVIFFLSWRMADLPPWVAALGLAAIVGGIMLWLGHNRGLYEPVPDDKKTP